MTKPAKCCLCNVTVKGLPNRGGLHLGTQAAAANQTAALGSHCTAPVALEARVAETRAARLRESATLPRSGSPATL